MNLLNLQRALAELFIEQRARNAYARDPRGFAARFELDAREQAQIDALAANAVDAYAETLVRKRCSEATRLLPRTHAVLGTRFAGVFAQWARRTRLARGDRRYVRDALGFCRSLQSNGRGVSSEERGAAAEDLRSLARRLGIFRW